MIHCIGNSHINTFSNNSDLNYRNVNNEYFKGYWIGPTIAYNFFEHHLQNAMNYIWGIPETDFVTLIVGEVDCRFHLPKQADFQNRSDLEIVEECVLRFVRCYDQIQQLGFKILIMGTHPTTTGGHNNDPDNPVWGNVQRRNNICVLWNENLKEESLKRNVPFVSIYKYLVDENNITKMEYFLDYCHLNSSKVFNFIIKELKDIKII